MYKMEIVPSQAAHYQILSFIKEAKKNDMFIDGMAYLAIIAFKGTDEGFNLTDKRVSDKLKEDGRFSGFVSNDGTVLKSMQGDLLPSF